jgi:hypothetical protein
MKLRNAFFCGVLVCLATAGSAAPKSDDDRPGRGDDLQLGRGANGNGNGLGHAYGHLKKELDELAESAWQASWRPPVIDIPRGPEHEGGPKHPRGDYGHPDKQPRPKPPVSAIPEPSAALLFGAGFALVGLRLRRVR